MNEFSWIFAKDKYDVETVKEYEAAIHLTDYKFVSKKPYRCSIQDQIEIESQDDRIEESTSPFAAPVTFAYKDGKKNRLCCDFHDLNQLVVPEPQPFPLADDFRVLILIVPFGQFHYN